MGSGGLFMLFYAKTVFTKFAYVEESYFFVAGLHTYMQVKVTSSIETTTKRIIPLSSSHISVPNF